MHNQNTDCDFYIKKNLSTSRVVRHLGKRHAEGIYARAAQKSLLLRMKILK